VEVNEDVGTTVGDVEHVRAVVGFAQGVDLNVVVHGGPALFFGEVTHVIVNGVSVVVVGHQGDGFHVFAILVGQHGRNGLGGGVGVVTETKAIATAVFAGGIARAADDREVQRFCAFAGILQRNGNGAADTAGN